MDIEASVLSLIAKLEAEEGKIDQYVKNQIQMALNFYQQEASDRIPQSQFAIRIQNLISEAHHKLSTVPSFNNGHQILPKSDREISRLKEYLFCLEKSINSGRIKPDKYKMVLNDAISWGLHIDKSNKPFTEKELPSVAIIFLKLFVNSPATKLMTKLDESLSTLDTTFKNISTLNVQNADLSDIENVKAKISRIGETLTATTKVFNHIEQEINSYDPSVLLTTIASELNMLHSEVENLQVPVQENALKMHIEKLSHFINFRIPKVPNNNEETKESKKQLIDLASTICENLKNMNAKHLSLGTIESTASKIAASHDEFKNKKIKLEVLIKQIQSVYTINKALNRKKDELISKISGFMGQKLDDQMIVGPESR